MDARTMLEMIVMLMNAIKRKDADMTVSTTRSIAVLAMVAPDEWATATGLIQEQINYLYQEQKEGQPNNG